MKLGSFSRFAVLGLYLSLAGLVVSCGKGKVTSKDISIEFGFPLDGDRITSSDDRNDATPDVIEIDVVVRVVGLEDGETVNLSNDIDVSGGTPREISGTVAAGVVQFPSYALPTADEEIVVTLRAALPSVAQSAQCDRTNCDEARINVVRRVCEFNTPPSGGPTLTAEDPAYVDATDPFDPFEIDVIADCVGGSAGDLVALTVNGGAAVTATEDAAGRVTYSRVALREGGNDLRVVPVQDAAGQTPTGAETQLTVDVDTGACTAWIEPLDGSRLLADFDADADPSTGMQATRLDLVTDCADTARVDLFVSTPGPTVCDGHGDPTTCEGDAFCSWSDGEQACLPDCGLATNRVGCTTLGGCSWSVGGGGSCERWREVTSMCDGFTDSGSCEADAICNWDTGECVPDCAASGTRSACEELGGCLWSTAGGGQCLLGTPQTLSDPAGARFRVTGVKLPTSIDPFDVGVAGIVDDGTQTGTAVPVSYWVDPDPPRIVSASPGDGACLGVLQDLYGTPADGIQIDAFGLLTGAGDGAEAWLTVGSETCATSANCTGSLACGHGVCAPGCVNDSECAAPLVCRDSVCRRVGTVSGGTVVIPEVDLPVGLVTMSYVGFDLAGNETAPTLSGVSVFETAPTVAISDPTNTAVLGSGADGDTQLAGLQYDVQVDVTDVAAGTAGTLVISGQAPVSFTPPAGAGGTATIPVTLVDGVHTMRARVLDPCGNIVESPPITVTVTADLPDLLVVAYTDFANRVSVTDGSTLNVSSVDLDIVAGTSLGGLDRTVSVTAYPVVDTSGGDRQCSGTPVTGPGGTMPAADAGLLVTGVPLAPGDNCLEISVDDGINARSATFVLVVRNAVPAVAISAPSSGTLDAGTDDSNGALPGFNTSVVVALSGGPGTGGANDIDGTLELRISSGGTLYNVLTVPAPANTTPVSFVDASLPTGAVDLVAAYVDGFGNVSTSAPVSLTVTASGPAVVVASPTDGSQAQSAGFSIDVALTGGTAPDSCQLFVDEVADGSSVSWTASPQTLTSSSQGEGSHTFRADCTNGDGTTSTQTITVKIDDTPPVAPVLVNEPADAPGRLVFDQAQAWINAMVPDQSSAAGFQHSISGLVPTSGQSPIGWTVELTATPQSGSPSVYTRVLTSGGDPTLVVFDGVELGTAEEEITFSLTVTDAAGNASATTSAILTKDFTPPEVTQTDPDPKSTLLDSDNDVDADNAFVDVAFTYRVTGADPSSDLSLEIAPPPADHAAGDFPLLEPITGGSIAYPTVAFADGTYVATARAVDQAGNVGQVIHGFDVKGSAVRVTWAFPSASGTLNSEDDVDAVLAGFQGTFAFNAVGFKAGTEVTLCSTIDPVGGSAACRWGSDGTQDPTAPDRGVVVGRGFLSGSEKGASVVISGVTLAEGAQALHAEATDADQDPDVSSTFLDFEVDSVPPEIAGLGLDDNSASNDDAGSGLIRLNATEGTPAGGRLTTQVTVTVTGSAAGEQVRVLSDFPSAGTVVGSGSLTGAGSATFTVSLLEGQQTLTATATDVNGNPNDPGLNPEPALDAVVDITPPTVSLPSAAFTPYTSAHGAINDAGTAGVRTDDTLEVGISLTIGDNLSLDNGSATLARYAASTGGAPLATPNTQPLAGGQTSVVFPAFGLGAGLNYLEVALADAAGNTTTPGRELYAADFYGPALVLEAWNAADTPLTCTSGTPCATDVFDPGAAGNRATLDPNDADTWRSGGTDLVFSLSGCANSDPSLEDCSVTPITVRLESRIAGSSEPFAPVFNSTYGESADVLAGTSYLSKAPFEFDPGDVREVRLRATDLNGNVETSGALFMQLNVNGVLLSVERLDVDVNPTGDFLEDGEYWGSGENLATAPAFATHLRVRVVDVGSLGPTDVEIIVQPSGTSQSATLVSGAADFLNVPLTTSPDPSALNPNTVTVNVTCGTGACGTRDFSDVIADVEAPTYQWDRCQLCALGVPLVNASVCASCSDADADANANLAGASDPAIWNAAGDQDGNTGNGFTMLTSGTPLAVKLRDVENGQVVTVNSNRGGLTGNTTLSTGCPAAGSCRATFAALSVPSLSGTEAHQLTISFTDRAGNPAVPEPPRPDETLYAVADVIPPAGVNATVCIGESTTPTGVSPPSSDPTTYEAPACSVECSAAPCDRRAGDATLFWQAPADDGASGDAVVSYDIVVAARGIPYPDSNGSSYTLCTDIDPAGDVEQLLSVAATAAPGDLERVSVSGLFPHRSYCFGVLAVDDVGNRALLADSVAERALPLINYPDIVPFDPITRQDDPAGAALYTDADAGNFFGYRLVNVGDVDGDARDDLAASRINFVSGTPPTAVSLFLSGGDPTTPAVVIEAPASTGAVGGLFGVSVAGGDFDDDGLNDIAICASAVSVAGVSGGGLYMYWGVATQGIRRDVNETDDTLPSPFPDVAIFGPANAQFCSQVLIANTDGSAGAELISSTGIAGQVGGIEDPKVYGFRGGDRDRFPTSPPATARITLDLTSPIVGGGFSDRPDFAIVRRDDGNAGSFPWSITAADVTGDGTMELVASDHRANHDSGVCVGCGEVYVYEGGAGLIGELAPPNQNPSQLLHTLRYVTGQTNFGQSLARVPQPLGPSDSGDWLLVQIGSARVLAFKGTSNGTPGIDPPTYPRPADEYRELDRRTWDNRLPNSFGFTMSAVGDLDADGGLDFFVGPDILTSVANPSFLYSFNRSTETFEKRVVFEGSADFGGGAAGVSGFLDTGVARSPQLVISSSGTDSIVLFH